LKSGGGHQVIAEIEEVERRHGLQHVDLIQQDALDLHDARAVRDGLTDAFFGDGGLPEGREDRVELPQDLLEPELVRLVDDDEEHLVVRRAAMQGALHLLGSEKPIELQVIRVVDGTARLFSVHGG
jgi:hypothetical protein